MSSLFSAPAWATRPRADEDDDAEAQPNSSNLFSHSNSFQAIQRERLERERRRKEKEKEREKHKQERTESKKQQKGVKRESTGDEDASGSIKRRRITSDDMEKLLAESGFSKSKAIDLGDSDDEEELEEPPSASKRRSPRFNRTRDLSSPARTRSRLNDSINVDGAVGIEASTNELQPPRAPEPESEEEYDSDPELAELQRQARAKAKQKHGLNGQIPNIARNIGTAPSHLPTPPPTDPAVQILVTSLLPNTNPLICYRKLSQNLAPIREMWCKRQGFDEVFSDRIFLTYRGRRLWNATTVQRLGIGVDAFGNVQLEEDHSKEGVDKIHVEAMTEELFQEMKAEKAKQSRIDSGIYVAEEEEVDDDAGGAAPEPESKQLHLLVKAKGQKDWKVRVTPVSLFFAVALFTRKQLTSCTGDPHRENPQGGEEESWHSSRADRAPRF